MIQNRRAGGRKHILLRKASPRESTYFAILLIVVLSAATIYAAGSIHAGQHHIIASQRKLREMNVVIQGQDRFQGIHTSNSSKCVFIRGTVNTNNERKYLKRLAESMDFDLTLMLDVEVQNKK